MKMNIFALSTVTFVLSIAATPTLASTSLCESYAQQADADTVKTIKSVSSTSKKLTDAEKGMIQATILTGHAEKPLTAEEALAEFSDDNGPNAGSLHYLEVKHNKHTFKVVRVTYYPGDNEYGAIFSLGSKGTDYPGLIGLVGDGDISCLTYE